MKTDLDDQKIVNEEFRRMQLAKVLKTNGGRRRDTHAHENSPFLKIDQVLQLIPVGHSKLYQMIKDGEFPKQIKLSRNSVAWSKKDVQAWIDEKLKT